MDLITKGYYSLNLTSPIPSDLIYTFTSRPLSLHSEAVAGAGGRW